jgi:cytochrome c peroxidase
MAVPDIGPLQVTVPVQPTNLNYQGKVEWGKLLVADGRLSKNNQTSWAFCHLPRTGLADPR